MKSDMLLEILILAQLGLAQLMGEKNELCIDILKKIEEKTGYGPREVDEQLKKFIKLMSDSVESDGPQQIFAMDTEL